MIWQCTRSLQLCSFHDTTRHRTSTTVETLPRKIWSCYKANQSIVKAVCCAMGGFQRSSLFCFVLFFFLKKRRSASRTWTYNHARGFGPACSSLCVVLIRIYKRRKTKTKQQHPCCKLLSWLRWLWSSLIICQISQLSNCISIVKYHLRNRSFFLFWRHNKNNKLTGDLQLIVSMSELRAVIITLNFKMLFLQLILHFVNALDIEWPDQHTSSVACCYSLKNLSSDQWNQMLICIVTTSLSDFYFFNT